MDDNVGGRSQRARLTCAQCHRRKIKCDKNIPCESCIKRGLIDECRRGDDASSHLTPDPVAQGDSQAANDVLQALLQRVAELESRLQPQERPESEADLQEEEDLHSLIIGGNTAPAESDECDAATVLEFLAWGRNKNVDFANAPEHQSGPRQHMNQSIRELAEVDFQAEAGRRAQIDFLESLMPTSKHLEMFVHYHHKSLLWYHNSYSSKIFSDDLNSFLREHNGSIRFDQLNFQWLALLFAILTGSMTCASQATLRDWGFSGDEQAILSQKWYEATIICLNLSNYLEFHTVYSVQAIATLTISAHVIGKSNSQSVLLSAAGRICQSLGLHRLRPETGGMSIQERRKREVGSRVMAQLCTQDWFQIPFSESYALSSNLHNTVRPSNCNDEDMDVQPPSIPTQASYCNFRYDIAALMPALLDATSKCNTLYTKYENVLKFDEKMRKLATASIPTFLSKNAPVDLQWPNFASWGRRSLTICAAHKIIMIHRNFLGLSFTNSMFSFTRRTCLAAAKTILKEALAPYDEHGPVIWIEQAFSIAAGIILGLDSAYREPHDPEFEEHRQLLQDCVAYLRRFNHSKIASRGVQLLTHLQQELGSPSSRATRKRGHSDDNSGNPPAKRSRLANMHAFIRDASHNLGVTSPSTTANDQVTPSAETNWESFLDLLGPYTDFDGENLFEGILTA